MYCPSCGAEYEAHVTTCADCEAALVADPSRAVAPPAHLGRFHPAIAREVVAFARRRGIEPDGAALALDGSATDRPSTGVGGPPEPGGAGPGGAGVVLRVPAERRDGLRADLVVAWPSLFEALDVEEQRELRRLEGPLAGWYDPPTGVWVDRQGRLRASPPADEEEAADAERALGPALAVIGLLALLVAWYVGPGLLRLVAAVGGLGLLLLGLFAPR